MVAILAIRYRSMEVLIEFGQAGATFWTELDDGARWTQWRTTNLAVRGGTLSGRKQRGEEGLALLAALANLLMVCGWQMRGGRRAVFEAVSRRISESSFLIVVVSCWKSMEHSLSLFGMLCA